MTHEDAPIIEQFHFAKPKGTLEWAKLKAIEGKRVQKWHEAEPDKGSWGDRDPFTFDNLQHGDTRWRERPPPPPSIEEAMGAIERVVQTHVAWGTKLANVEELHDLLSRWRGRDGA